MNKVEDCIVVFTAKGPSRVVSDGGSQSWVLDPVRARQCTYLVCTQNQHNKHAYSSATEPHGCGFLLGRISEIRRPTDPDDGDRWLIAISAFARINIASLWDGGRNPVRYTSLAELGIDIEGLEWQEVVSVRDPDPPPRPREPASREQEPLLTIAEAKQRLAVTFGVKPDAVEITIRG